MTKRLSQHPARAPAATAAQILRRGVRERSSKPVKTEHCRARQRREVKHVAGQLPRRGWGGGPFLAVIEGLLRALGVRQDQEEYAAPMLFKLAGRLGSHAVRRIGEQYAPVADALKDNKMTVAAHINQDDRRQPHLHQLR